MSFGKAGAIGAMGVGAMRRMLLVACAMICLPANAAVLTFSCDGTMKEEAQRKAHAITKMGLIVNSDAGASALSPIVFSNSGFQCQALRDHPCRAHCSLRGRGVPSHEMA